MAYLEWQPNLSVGVTELDEHHKQLVALINQVYDSLAAVDQQERLARVLNDLVAYTRFHFDREEHYLRVNGYPDYNSHRAAHAALVQQVMELQDRINRDPASVKAMDTMDFLSRWLIQHIVGQDLKYKSYLAKE
ncbi:MAG: bacteriohemerythrin [Magnetospirillum sp. WYHS-4]